MREILFRGKRKDNGEWVEGHLIQSPYLGEVRSWISTPEDKTRLRTIATYYGDWRAVEVGTDTICQYTGLTDKNGNKIWENDIVHLFGKDTIRNYDWKAVIEFGNPNSLYSWGYQLKPIGHFEYNEDILCWVGMEEANIYCEVTGNIFDNPDLLKGE